MYSTVVTYSVCIYIYLYDMLGYKPIVQECCQYMRDYQVKKVGKLINGLMYK